MATKPSTQDDLGFADVLPIRFDEFIDLLEAHGCSFIKSEYAMYVERKDSDKEHQATMENMAAGVRLAPHLLNSICRRLGLRPRDVLEEK